MSGIAGILSSIQSDRNLEGVFNSLFQSIAVNKCKVSDQRTIGKHGIVGVGELEGFEPKVYYSEEKGIKVLVWGHTCFNESETVCEDFSGASLIRLWEKHGNHFANYLSGDFVIFLFEEQTNKMVLCNSLFGMLPVYVYIKNEILIFSSRLQSFFDMGHLSPKLNKVALFHYLLFGYPVDSSTFLEDVIMLPAASIVSNERETWSIEKYDTHDFLLEGPKYSFKEGLDIVDKSLFKAIKSISKLSHPIGCSITGGWDGRLVLSYLTKIGIEELFLFTYGKINQKDLIIGKSLAERFGFEHIPINLDEEFILQYPVLSMESINASDGLKGFNRGHYILMAKVLANRSNLIITGNCGSNILKIVQGGGGVVNNQLINLYALGGGLEDRASIIFNTFLSKNTWIKAFIEKDAFINSIIASEVMHNKNVPPNYQFYHFLLTNVERKYFGIEAASYSSYLYNISPFINSEFIRALVQTPFFGGHYKFLETNPFVRIQLSKLYAELMVRNHKGLASYTSDRGFPITWFLSSHGRAMGYVKKKLNNAFKMAPDKDPFNHQKGFNTIRHDLPMHPSFFKNDSIEVLSEQHIRALSISCWVKENFSFDD